MPMKNLKKPICTLLCGAILCGCAGGSDSQQSIVSSQTSSQDSSVSVVMAGDEELNRLYSFSWDLFNQVRHEKEGQLVSPLSALFALGMTANGAKGGTLEQMEEALNLSVDQINALSRSALDSADADSTRTLEIANSIWLNQDQADSFIDSYGKLLDQDYDAQSFEFDASKDPQKEIDQWISEKTRGLIDQMPADLSAETALVLVNALAFDSAWAVNYEDSQIVHAPFHNVDGTEAQVQMLTSDEEDLVMAEGLKGFIKPYESYRYGLAVLIPEDENRLLGDVLANVDGTRLLNALRTPQAATIHASFPEYEFSSEMKLNDTLKSMGMELPFEDGADFSGMIEGGNIAISEVLQKARIKVNRAGTKAAAATEVVMNETAALITEDEVDVICDRPFLYILMDLDTATPVFMGTIQSMENNQPDQ